MSTTKVGKSSIYSVQFYMMDGQDAKDDSHIEITEKAIQSEGKPVPGGLSSPQLGTDRLTWNCQTCHNNKNNCPGHHGHAHMKYPLQSPEFQKEIAKWLKIICHSCGSFVINPNFLKSKKYTADQILSEFTKKVRSGNEKHRLCYICKVEHPWITKDVAKGHIIWREYFVKKSKTKPTRKTPMYNQEILDILSRITNDQCLLMGKPLISHPKKLILTDIVVSSVVIRPELKRIGGSRSTMSDTTTSLKTIFEFNSSIPKVLPEEVDKKLQGKLVLIDMNLFEMIQGSSATSKGLKLMTNTNKQAMSIANRMPTKAGRIRGNITGKRTTKMARSVITGNPSLNINQVGIPKLICKSITIEQTVRPWTRSFLTKCYENGPDNYPGCVKITSVDTKKDIYLGRLPSGYVLKDGDIVHRHVVNGDTVGLNRQPSLSYSSISTLKVKVINGLTIQFNPIICPLFNADFDGDEMNVIFIDAVEGVVEGNIISSVYQWFISYQNSLPILGLFQDTVVGISEMTRSNVNIHPFHAMRMLNRVTNYNSVYIDKTKHINSRDLVSMFIPDVNFSKTAKFYVKDFSDYVEYDPTETHVVVEKGQLIQGVLDKSTVGQNAEGGLFHTIYGEYGAAVAIDCMFNMQQIADAFLYYHGATFGLGDVMVDKKTSAIIDAEVQKVIDVSVDISNKYESGQLVPPAGMTVSEFYEEQQMEALSHGDEFIIPIVKSIDHKNNNLWKFISVGSRGKTTNMISIYSAKGSIAVGGKRIIEELDGRSSIFFQRHDTNPIARGYDPSNFSKGIRPETYLFAAEECRGHLITIALGTAVGGALNRNGTKNLEDIIVNNTLAAAKKGRVVQLLCGETGFDPRQMERVKFKTIMSNRQDFVKNYHAKISNKQISNGYKTKIVQKVLDEEFDILQEHRDLYRDIFLQIESENRGHEILTDNIRMPVNIERILRNVAGLTDENKNNLDVVASKKRVDDLCENIGRLYLGNIDGPVPDHIYHAVTLLEICIRTYLCTMNLLKFKISNIQLEIVIERIKSKIKSSFIAYGTTIGIISAQSVSEPVTQFFLDAKHRSGLKKAKTNIAVRFDEIIKNKETTKMGNPQMLLTPLEEYKWDKHKVEEISNHIEMLKLSRFVKTTQVFVESFKNPVHSKYKHESKLIKQFIADDIINKPPVDLLNWCIRYTLSSEEIILKNMKLRTVYLTLMEKFPNLYIVYDPNILTDIVVFRIYIKPNQFKKEKNITKKKVIELANTLTDTIIRGIDGVTSTAVISIPHTVVNQDDDSLEVKNFYAIETDGTNLSQIMENPYLDVYKCYSTSVREIEWHFGIGAARNKIVSELNSIIRGSSNAEFVTIYADEMASRRKVTSIQRSGLGKREQNQVFQRMSFGAPIQVGQLAAINGQKDPLHGISAKMIVGTTPRFGTSYNDIGVDYNYLAKNKLTTKSHTAMLDEL